MNDFFNIIFQNEDFIVINKLKAISFHSENGPGLFHVIQSKFENIKLYPVHRIDKVTTGLMIIAKNSEAAAEFGKIFETRLIEKTYMAFSDCRGRLSEGTISGDMKKARRGMYVLRKTQVNPAITEFKSIQIEKKLFLFLIRIHTGKTHQIRVALKSIGSPILGDPLYYPKNKMQNEHKITYLHSFSIKFEFKKFNYSFKNFPEYKDLFKNNDSERLARQTADEFINP